MNDNMNNMVQYFVITTRKVVLLNLIKAGIVVPGIGSPNSSPHPTRRLLPLCFASQNQS